MSPRGAKPVDFPVTVKVQFGTSGYTTQAVGGQRASSTSSEAIAVCRLVDKLVAALGLPKLALAYLKLPAKGLKPGESVWSITAKDAQ